MLQLKLFVEFQLTLELSRRSPLPGGLHGAMLMHSAHRISGRIKKHTATELLVAAAASIAVLVRFSMPHSAQIQKAAVSIHDSIKTS